MHPSLTLKNATYYCDSMFRQDNNYGRKRCKILMHKNDCSNQTNTTTQQNRTKASRKRMKKSNQSHSQMKLQLKNQVSSLFSKNSTIDKNEILPDYEV